MAEVQHPSVSQVELLTGHGVSMRLFTATKDDNFLYISPLRLEYIQERLPLITSALVVKYFKHACTEYLFNYFTAFFADFQRVVGRFGNNDGDLLALFEEYKRDSVPSTSTDPRFDKLNSLRNWLIFPEVPLIMCGTSKEGSNSGYGVTEGLARKMLCNLAPLLIRLRQHTFRNISKLFATFNIFVEKGFGPDKFSDMTTFLILPALLSYTTEVCQDLERQGQLKNGLSISEELDISQIVEKFHNLSSDHENYKRFGRLEFLKTYCRTKKYRLPKIVIAGTESLRLLVPALLLDCSAELFSGRRTLLSFAVREPELRKKVVAHQIERIQAQMTNVLIGAANSAFHSLMKRFQLGETLQSIVAVISVEELDKFFDKCQRTVMDCAILLPESRHMWQFYSHLIDQRATISNIHKVYPTELPNSVIKSAFWNDLVYQSELPVNIRGAILPPSRERTAVQTVIDEQIQQYDNSLRLAATGENDYYAIAFQFTHQSKSIACLATAYNALPFLTELDKVLCLNATGNSRRAKCLLIAAIYDKTNNPGFASNKLLTHASIVSLDKNGNVVQSFRTLTNGHQNDMQELSDAVSQFNDEMQSVMATLGEHRDTATAPFTDGTTHLLSPTNGWSFSDPTLKDGDTPTSATGQRAQNWREWLAKAEQKGQLLGTDESLLKRTLQLTLNDVEQYPNLVNDKSRVLVDTTGRIVQMVHHLNPQIFDVLGIVIDPRPDTATETDIEMHEWKTHHVDMLMTHAMFEYLKKVSLNDEPRAGVDVPAMIHPRGTEGIFSSVKPNLTICSLNAKHLCAPLKESVDLLQYSYTLNSDQLADIIVVQEAHVLDAATKAWISKNRMISYQPSDGTGKVRKEEIPTCFFNPATVRFTRGIYLQPVLVNIPAHGPANAHNKTPFLFEFELTVHETVHRFGIISVHFIEGDDSRLASGRQMEMKEIAKRILQLRSSDHLDKPVHYIVAGDINAHSGREIEKMTEALSQITGTPYRALNDDPVRNTNTDLTKPYDNIFVPSQIEISSALIIGDLKELGRRKRISGHLATVYSDHNPLSFSIDFARKHKQKREGGAVQNKRAKREDGASASTSSGAREEGST